MSSSTSLDKSVFWDRRAVLYCDSRIQIDRAQSRESGLESSLESSLEPGQWVVLKSLRDPYPSLARIEQLKHEFEIGTLFGTVSSHTPSIAVLQVLDFKYENNRPVLVLEDINGISLRHWLADQCGPTGLSLDLFWPIAMQLITGLIHIHDCGVIHKDLKPENILIVPESLQIKIADFSIAIAQSQERIAIGNPTQLEGTLAYLAPEQTGRMNRVVDYRSDFYGLGVVLYELLSGQLPFQQSEPLKLIHDHLTRSPRSLTEFRADLPSRLNDIIVKLLAKNAEDRYQSLEGLQQELARCQAGEPVPVGKFDRSDRLNLPQTLYGREAEVQNLLAAFDRVAAGGSECILVAGYSGIGKSALVNEIHRPITGVQGSFVVGKFDQLQRGEPYSALLQALRSLLRQILLAPQAELTQWRDRLRSGSGQSGTVLRSVLPEWAILFADGSNSSNLAETAQVSPAQVSPAQVSPAQLNQALRSLLQQCATVEHPLVLFLDDLQWADSASLEVLESLLTQASCPYFLLIGAYRDNEVTAIHPLTHTLQKIDPDRLTTLVLQPLSPDDIDDFLNDLLTIRNQTHSHIHSQTRSQINSQTHSQTCSLSALLYSQTQGNPFFLTQLLKTLHQEQLLRFDRSVDRWVWDAEDIRQGLHMQGDVIDLLMRNLQKLPTPTTDRLKWAACLGAQFTIADLAAITLSDTSEVIQHLTPAVTAGLLFPMKDASSHDSHFYSQYRFLHDRVQQAAYGLTAPEDRPTIHGTIARQLSAAPVFEQVHHFNRALEVLTDPAEQRHVAQLNLQAGKQARYSAAYQSAKTYLSIAQTLLPEGCWEQEPELTRSIIGALAEANFLCLHWDAAQHCLDQINQQSIPLLDRIPLVELQMDLRIAQGQQRDAIDVGLAAIEQLGIPVLQGVEDFAHLPNLHTLAALPTVPIMTDPHHLASLRLLSRLAPITYQVTPEIYPRVAQTMLHLCLTHGHSALAAFVYGAYGAFLQSIVGDPEQAYHSGQIALHLLDQFPDQTLDVKVYMVVGTYALPCKQSLSQTLPTLYKGIQRGLETGNLPHMGLSVMAYCTHLLFSGQPIAQIQPKIEYYIHHLQDYQQRPHEHYLQVINGLLNRLLNGLLNRFTNRLENESVHRSENELLNHAVNSSKASKASKEGTAEGAELLESIALQFKSAGNYQGLFAMALMAAIDDCISNRDRTAFDRLQSVRPFKKSALGLVSLTRFHFYAALSAIAIGEDGLDDLACLRHWADHAPNNYQHLVDCLEAELAGIEGRDLEAMDGYDRAIDRAEAQELLPDLALFYERAGLFYGRRGRVKIARTYMMEAYYSYDRWGATVKCAALSATYPEWFSDRQQDLPSLDRHETVVASPSLPHLALFCPPDAIDLLTLMKAAETIAAEVVLSTLVSTLLEVLTENTGAQKVALMLGDTDRWMVEAIYPTTASDGVPRRLIDYGLRLQEWVLYEDARSDMQALADPYVQAVQPRSILIVPIQYQGRLLGAVYLENQHLTGAFTHQRRQSVNLLMSQVAIAIEHAKLYQQEQEKARQLEQSLEQLKQSQAQLVQSEKIASLGQLVAGVAHEINNPMGFISGNLNHAQDYIQDLFQHLALYQEATPTPNRSITVHAEAIELEYLLADLPKMLASMQLGIDRIQGIMQSLRNFSRRDADHPVPMDIHQGIDSTLIILSHRLKANESRPAIAVVKHYGPLPLVKVYGGQLNQVLMNLMANAIEALDESNRGKSYQAIVQTPNQITITTEYLTTEPLGDQVRIAIEDNGPGISAAVQAKIFDPFFTTKPEGKGTGLGLSISHQIITVHHGGSLSCEALPTGGTRFEIVLPVAAQ